MNTKLGLYTYDLPRSITEGFPALVLKPITEDPSTYVNRDDAEAVELLIARQGAVNHMAQCLPNLRWIQLLNAGFERVDLEALRRRGILLTNARSVYSTTIAEDVIAKMLILGRCYRRHFLDQQARFWPDEQQLGNENVDLRGRILGILGAGAIGREIAVRARVFGMSVRGYDPYLAAQEGFDAVYQDPDGLERLLGESDFVVTSLPVTEETRDLINRRTLKMMKPTAFLINVARGEIVCEPDLIAALEAGQIRGAALDVVKHEPLDAGDPLWDAPNLLITPHRAAFGDQMHDWMCHLIAENLRHYLSGEPLQNRVV